MHITTPKNRQHAQVLLIQAELHAEDYDKRNAEYLARGVSVEFSELNWQRVAAYRALVETDEETNQVPLEADL